MGGIHSKKTHAPGLSSPQHLFSAWADIVRRMRSAARIALFVDFDGTLTPIRRRPGRVHLGDQVRRLLEEISGNGVTVGIVSGRRGAGGVGGGGGRGGWELGG